MAFVYRFFLQCITCPGNEVFKCRISVQIGYSYEVPDNNGVKNKNAFFSN